MAESSNPNVRPLTPPGTTPLPGFLNRLALRTAQLPWWLIILIVGLVVALYGIATTATYRRALNYVTNNPQLDTTDFQRVTYRATVNGKVQTISGMLTATNGDTLTIRTVDEVVTGIPKNLVTDRKTGPGTCPENAPAGCVPPTITALTLPARPLEGAFYTETATEYRIQLDSGEIVPVLKVDVRPSVKLDPPNCTPDISGTCRISVVVPASTVKGQILSETPTEYLVQTVAPQYIMLNRADISETISERPGQCAINNISSCQEGIFLTGFLAISSYLIALVIGLLLALMRISSNVVFKNFATLYVEMIRGIPILVILLIFYFGIGPWIRDTIHIPMPEVLRAMLGLAVAYGAFLAEIFRAGIQSISRGQMEAARSLGMTYIQAMRYVILPQAIRVVLPPLGNDFISMLKDTSLVALISLAEMTQLATLLNGRTYLPFPSFLTIAVLYLIMTLFLSFIVRSIEHRVRLPA